MPLDRWQGRAANAWANQLGVAAAEFHARIESTSDRARELVEEGRPLPAIVLADRQTAGRGRRGRRWASNTSRGLWFTMARATRGDAETALSLRVGLAVVRALDSVAPEVGTLIKWPNDILAGGQKLGGILCERVRGAVLVGVGVNLNQTRRELPAGLAPPATSLLLQTGRSACRAQALRQIVAELQALWDPSPASVASSSDLSVAIPADELAALNARSALRGRPLSVTGVVRHVSGPLAKVDALRATGGRLLADGAMSVRTDAGSRLRIVAGTIELRS